MPDITTTGTYTDASTGFGFLAAVNNPRTLRPYRRVLLFAGSALGTTVEVKYTDDEGTDHTLQNGSVTILPTSIVVDEAPVPLKIVVTGGSPNFNVTGN